MKPTPEQQARSAKISQRCAEVAGIEVKQHSRLDRLLWVSPYPQHSCRWDILDPRAFQAFVLGLDDEYTRPEFLVALHTAALAEGSSLFEPAGMLAFAEAVLAEVDRNA